ncbi:endonuclease/exonuclease/phosphatase family protein [Zunongwangia profunda]|uniref:endonuclease/exonuclease/phosphatase family protein n=1 Tax=Zunongwangia profunda TaxID=398743 RepID=UPI001D193A09|nr:endonuclease/exonuclease/phosphatase family protein [Zunongwangia profunda]MCC4230107.1 endonuclease/exonuclease/phosphatase family protein [Zunongwangia profunda]
MFQYKIGFSNTSFFNVIYKAHSQKLVRSEVIVLSYNIHHANPPSQSEVINLDTIATIIKNSKADIVGLQEVDIY